MAGAHRAPAIRTGHAELRRCAGLLCSGARPPVLVAKRSGICKRLTSPGGCAALRGPWESHGPRVWPVPLLTASAG